MLKYNSKNFNKYSLYKEIDLWKTYKITKNIDIRNFFIYKNLNLVNLISKKIYNNKFDLLEFNDLFNCGIIGLIDAIEKYNIEKHKDFKVYAYFRIRGSIYDEIRNVDWVPRSVRKNIKLLSQTIDKDISDMNYQDYKLIVNKLNLDCNFINKVLYNNCKANVLYLDDNNNSLNVSFKDTLTSNDLDSVDYLEKLNLSKFLKKIIFELTDIERKIIVCYYYENMSFKDIMWLLNVSQSRVSQIYTEALKKLKIKLNKFLN